MKGCKCYKTKRTIQFPESTLFCKVKYFNKGMTQMDESNARKVNWFVRGLLIVFILYLLGIITTGFLIGNPSYSLTPEYITLFILITILILSESFDNLSMGKYLSLSREIKKKKEEVNEIKQENTDLREHIIKMTTLINQNQHQSNTTINGLTPELLHMLGVIKAKDNKDDEIDIGNISISETPTNTDMLSSITVSDPKMPQYNKRDFFRFAEKESIDNYLEKHLIPEGNIIRDAQFTPAFQGLDPIMERRIIFDAYFKTEFKEYFFEVLLSINPMTLDRLYVQLSKINFYNQAKHVKGQLIVLIVEFPNELDSTSVRQPFRPERIIEAFQPAISNDLLTIELVPFSIEDIERWKKELN